MNDIEFKHVESNGIKLRLAMMGDGPLVIFCHGWPEMCIRDRDRSIFYEEYD